MCYSLLLLLLLSRFGRVRLCATPWTAAYQAPPSMGFSRQEDWSGLPFLLQCMKVKSESEITQSCPTLSGPMDCSLPGSSVHGIFQARGLEWAAIAFSESLQRQMQMPLLLLSYWHMLLASANLHLTGQCQFIVDRTKSIAEKMKKTNLRYI